MSKCLRVVGNETIVFDQRFNFFLILYRSDHFLAYFGDDKQMNAIMLRCVVARERTLTPFARETLSLDTLWPATQ